MLCQNGFSIWKPLAFISPNLCQTQVILSEWEAERCLIIAIESGLGWEVRPAAPARHREEQMPAQLRTQKTDAFQKEAGSWVWKIIFRPWSLRQISILQLCQKPLCFCSIVLWCAGIQTVYLDSDKLSWDVSLFSPVPGTFCELSNASELLPLVMVITLPNLCEDKMKLSVKPGHTDASFKLLFSGLKMN